MLGYGMRDTGCGMRDAGYGIRDTGCGIQDAGYRMRDAGCGMQDAGCRIRKRRRRKIRVKDKGDAGCGRIKRGAPTALFIFSLGQIAPGVGDVPGCAL